tara:strand:+ start:3390 stop:4415 length:1026 start_codon:yes stop_codon:yes gene_type:complete
MNINNTLKIYASKNFTPIKINSLKNVLNSPRIPILHQSKFLKEELSIRLSHRVFDLLKLPYGLPILSPIKNVIDLYCDSFDRIQNINVSKKSDIDDFCDLLSDIKDKHSNLEDNISNGLLQLNREFEPNLINYTLINKELDKFFLSRISIRTLISQNIELVKNNSSIIKNCRLDEIINDSVNEVNYICENNYSRYPSIQIINKDKEIVFPYIPSHIYYILNEILKNSCVAQIKNNNFCDSITIDYCEGKNDIIIQIIDNGISFPVKDIDNILTYSYSSNPIEDNYNSQNKPIMCGFGFGLPMARLYSKYFGGNLIITPMESKGTIISIYINKLGNNPEAFI